MSGPRGNKGSWRDRQERDPYVKQARKDGYRSRAVYKLEEIDKRVKLFRPGQVVVDLGAAPGGWSQYAAEQLKGRGAVYALDLLPLDAIADVHIIQGDFTEDSVLQQLLAALDGRAADLVISDMAPNLSGTRAVDQPRSIYLAELALDFARQNLAAKGDFVCKLFQGEGFDALVTDIRRQFGQVKVTKPAASRPASREVYLVARNFRL